MHSTDTDTETDELQFIHTANNTTSSSTHTVLPLASSVSNAYILSKLAIGALETLFSLYYVDIFLTVHALDTHWFYLGQSFYILWNAINDPLFAWIQDKYPQSKVNALFYFGPLYALAFLCTFLPIAQWIGYTSGASSSLLVGCHFIFTLFAFDGMFTYVCLAHCALFPLLTVCQEERLTLVRRGELSGLLIAPIVFIAGLLYDRTNLARFQFFVGFIAFIAAATMVFASRNIKTVIGHGCKTNCQPAIRNGTTEQSTATNAATTPSLRLFLSQFFTHRSMLLFICFNFLQILLLAFYNNFFVLILSSVYSDSNVDSTSDTIGWLLHDNQGMVLGISQLITPLWIVYLTSSSASQRKEKIVLGDADSSTLNADTLDRSYHSIRRLTYLKLGMSLCMFLIGSQFSSFLFVCFLFLTRALTTTTFSLFNLTLAELIDEDYTTHNRAQPFSASYFGINALFTKPAHSITPMVVLNVWNRFGFREKSSAAAQSYSSANPILSSPNSIELRYIIFLMCTLLPLVTGLIQILIWHFYSLHGQRLHQVKLLLHQRASLELKQLKQSTADDTPASGLELVEMDGFDSEGDAADMLLAESNETLASRLAEAKEKRKLKFQSTSQQQADIVVYK